MTLREQIVAEALTWEGSPWHHRACVKGVGVDCVRLLEAVAKAVGLLPEAWEVPEYSNEFHLHNTTEILLQVLADLGCLPVPLDARQPGDLVTMQYGRVSSHTAILVATDPDYILHAASDVGRVVHHRLDAKLLMRVRGVYAFPGVEVPA